MKEYMTDCTGRTYRRLTLKCDECPYRKPDNPGMPGSSTDYCVHPGQGGPKNLRQLYFPMFWKFKSKKEREAAFVCPMDGEDVRLEDPAVMDRNCAECFFYMSRLKACGHEDNVKKKEKRIVLKDVMPYDKACHLFKLEENAER